MASALTATLIPPSARSRLYRLASSSSPPGSWLNKGETAGTQDEADVLLGPFSSARNTATNGPKPDCIPARKKLTLSRPLRLVLEGEESIASDDVVMAMAINFTDEPQRPATLILTSRQHDNLQPLRDVRRSTPVCSKGLQAKS
jgi:hypothetical protein